MLYLFSVKVSIYLVSNSEKDIEQISPPLENKYYSSKSKNEFYAIKVRDR